MMKLNEILEANLIELNEKNLKELSDYISCGKKVTWILGAGVSKPAGIPLWTECLQRMWNRMLMLGKTNKANNNTDTDYFDKAMKNLQMQVKGSDAFLDMLNKEIKGESNSYDKVFVKEDVLEVAEYMRNFIYQTLDTSIEKRAELVFKEIVKDSLKPEETVKLSKDEWREKLNSMIAGKLADYLISDNKPDNKRQTVIVYNFDDLLEVALEQKMSDTSSCYVKTSAQTGQSNSENGIYIYHPHGLLKVLGADMGEESQKLVFTESSYKKLESKAYIWENSVQAQALSETSCIFLGFSGTDYNFRRILKNTEMGKEYRGQRHYFFISLESMIRSMMNDTKNNDEILYRKLLMTKKLYAQYIYWKNYGIIPIWTTRSELPEMLMKICNMNEK